MPITDYFIDLGIARSRGGQNRNNSHRHSQQLFSVELEDNGIFHIFGPALETKINIEFLTTIPPTIPTVPTVAMNLTKPK
jgi:hypothetical protein